MSSLEVLFQQGLTAYETQNYSEAEAAFLSCLKTNPASSEALLNLGNIHFQQKRFPEARELWHKAIDVNPLEAKAYLNLGNAYFEEKQYEQAIFFWEIFKKLNPQHAGVHFNLGVAYEAQADIFKAFHSFAIYISLCKAVDTEGLKLKRRMEQASEIAQHNLAVAERAMQRGNLERAREVYEENICLIPLQPKIYKHYATVLYKLGDFAKAMFWYEKAYNPKEPDLGALVNLAVAAEKQSEKLKALWAYSMVMKLSSRTPQVIQNRYKALWQGEGQALMSDTLMQIKEAIQLKVYAKANQLIEMLFDIVAYAEPSQLTEIRAQQTIVENIRNPKSQAGKKAYLLATQFEKENKLDLALLQYKRYLHLEPKGEKAQEAGEKCLLIEKTINTLALEFSEPKKLSTEAA